LGAMATYSARAMPANALWIKRALQLWHRAGIVIAADNSLLNDDDWVYVINHALAKPDTSPQASLLSNGLTGKYKRALGLKSVVNHRLDRGGRDNRIFICTNKSAVNLNRNICKPHGARVNLLAVPPCICECSHTHIHGSPGNGANDVTRWGFSEIEDAALGHPKSCSPGRGGGLASPHPLFIC